MAKLPIPDFGREYPDYQYRAYPKYLGEDADGQPVIVNDEKEHKERESDVVKDEPKADKPVKPAKAEAKLV